MAEEHRWSFQHVEERYPTHRVYSDPTSVRPLPSSPVALDALRVPGSSRGDVTLTDVLDATATEAEIRGNAIAGGYDAAFGGARLHRQPARS